MENKRAQRHRMKRGGSYSQALLLEVFCTGKKSDNSSSLSGRAEGSLRDYSQMMFPPWGECIIDINLICELVSFVEMEKNPADVLLNTITALTHWATLDLINRQREVQL